MAEKVQIEIEAVDNASETIGNLAGSFVGLDSALNLASRTVAEFQQIQSATVDKTVEYANQIRTLDKLNGQSAESNSRLVQVLDDYKVSVDDIMVASKKLKDNGLVPTISTVAELARKYQAIKDPADKLKFAQDNLGKSTKAWLEVLNQSPAVLEKQAQAVNENLIMTDKYLQQARELELAQDAINDSRQGLAYTTGNLLIPAEAQALDGLNAWMIGLDNFYNKHMSAKAAIDAGIQSVAESKAAMLANRDATEQAGEAYKKEAEQIKEAQKAQEAETKSNQDYLNSIGDLTSKIDDYKQKQGDLRAQYHELIAKKQELIAQGYGPESQAIQDVNTKLGENASKQNENAAEFEKDTHRRILAMAEEILSQDGLTKQESDALLAKGIKWGIYSSDAVSAMDEIMSSAHDLSSAINNIPNSKTINIMVNTAYMSSHTKDDNEFANVSGGGSSAIKHASGGTFMIPMSYGNEGFPMGNNDTASGGEMVRITPRGQSAGGDVNVYLTYAPALSLGTAAELQRNLKPLIIDGVKEAQAQGVI